MRSLEQIEFPAKLLDYFLFSNEIDINQRRQVQAYQVTYVILKDPVKDGGLSHASVLTNLQSILVVANSSPSQPQSTVSCPPPT